YSMYTARTPPRSTLFPYTTLFRSWPRSGTPTHPTGSRGEPSIKTCSGHRQRPPPPGSHALASTATTGRGGTACSETHTSPCRDQDRKSTRLNSSHVEISYAVFCLK